LKWAASRSERGFSLLELVIVVVLISMLLTIAIDRLLLFKAQAERTAMEQVLGNMRSGLTIRLAEMVVRGKLGDADKLAGSNPMLLLAVRPDNYLGEFFGPDPTSLGPGNWYYDSRDGVLCYLVESGEYFETLLPPPARARFRIRPVFDDLDGNGRYDPKVDALRGMQLAPLEPYGWNLRFLWPDWPWREREKAPSAARS
jgi:prepilin-type N-terminal cleavage/methylation domain-containing protein